MSAFDWPALMKVAFQGLRMEPTRFWALTPAEFAMMLGRSGALTPLTRSGLDKLLDAYPDTDLGNEHDRD
ncbi:rcc01693 family protein [Shimia abyssi]|uniref:rcc01693 family protein n=1 Tax=Shimia abyssi TaxID=1662395 RepID=UPI000D0E29E9|nr:rcc01693 family protein [Shimia abyssi]